MDTIKGIPIIDFISKIDKSNLQLTEPIWREIMSYRFLLYPDKFFEYIKPFDNYLTDIGIPNKSYIHNSKRKYFEKTVLDNSKIVSIIIENDNAGKLDLISNSIIKKYNIDRKSNIIDWSLFIEDNNFSELTLVAILEYYINFLGSTDDALSITESIFELYNNSLSFPLALACANVMAVNELPQSIDKYLLASKKTSSKIDVFFIKHRIATFSLKRLNNIKIAKNDINELFEYSNLFHNDDKIFAEVLAFNLKALMLHKINKNEEAYKIMNLGWNKLESINFDSLSFDSDEAKRYFIQYRSNMGWQKVMQKNNSDAKKIFEDLILFTTENNKRYLSEQLSYLGYTLLLCNENNEARKNFEKAEALIKNEGNLIRLNKVYELLAITENKLGNEKKAFEWLDFIVDIKTVGNTGYK